MRLFLLRGSPHAYAWRLARRWLVRVQLEERMPKTPKTRPAKTELVIITGLSGSGKGSVLKAFEDLGYYSVDNLPIDLLPKFADLTRDSSSIRSAALVVDVREAANLTNLPATYPRIPPPTPTPSS